MNKLYIANGKDIQKLTQGLLNEMNPLQGRDKLIKIGIKPNLVCATPASTGATTHPEIVEAIIIYLFNKSFKNVCILESSWVGDSTKRAMKVCGYDTLCEKYNIPFYDLKDDNYSIHSVDELELKICNKTKNLDYLINVPVIKGHCQTKITCALKNLKGLIPDSEKRRFHQLGLHKPIAYLNKAIKQDLIVADGICPDPYFEEGGSPKELNRIVAGYDPVLIDSYAAKILGYAPSEIEYINISQKIGIGKIMNNETEIININNVEVDNTPVKQIEKKYLNIIEEADACSACYSNLVMALNILHEKNLIQNIVEPISIGQSYKGYAGDLGIGDCTYNFKDHLSGCPPTTDEIVKFLKNYIIDN